MRKSLIIFLLVSVNTFPQNTEVAEKSASFLKIGISARAMGMGGAFSAVADDPSAIYWNTAALSDTLKNEITFMSNKWAQETSHTFLGMRRPLSSGGIGIGIIRLDYGEFERRDEYGVLLPDEFSPYDFASIIGVGYPVTESLSFGTALYLIKEKMDKESAETYSLNLDTLYKRGRMRVSCGFKNIGGKIKGFIPSCNLTGNIV